MSKADEMFEKLGYEKREQLDIYNKIWGELYFNKKNMVNISFDFEGHGICVYIKACDGIIEPAYIITEELQAINEKVKELGWN